MFKKTLNFNELARKRDALQEAIASFQRAFRMNSINGLGVIEEEVLLEEIDKVKTMSDEMEFDELEDLGEVQVTAESQNSEKVSDNNCMTNETFCSHDEACSDSANECTRLNSARNQACSSVSEDTMKQARDYSLKAEQKLEEVYTNLDRKMDRLSDKLDKIMVLMRTSLPAAAGGLSEQCSDCSSSSNESTEKSSGDEGDIENDSSFELDENRDHVAKFLPKQQSDVDRLAYDIFEYCYMLGDEGYLYTHDTLKNRMTKKPRYVDHAKSILRCMNPMGRIDTLSLMHFKTSLLKVESFCAAEKKQDMLNSDEVIAEVVEKMNASLHHKWNLYVAWKKKRKEPVIFKSLIEFISNELKNMKERSLVNCIFCTSDEHEINTCTKFRRLDSAKQNDFMQNHQTCNICYEQGHAGEHCSKGILPNFQSTAGNWDECESSDDKEIEKIEQEK